MGFPRKPENLKTAGHREHKSEEVKSLKKTLIKTDGETQWVRRAFPMTKQQSQKMDRCDGGGHRTVH